MKTITRSELSDLLTSGTSFALLEALPAKYFDAGHLPGAVHFPHDRVTANAARVVPDLDRRIVVYCASDTCESSHVAAATLTRLGYRDVSVYVGGKKDWQEAGLPVEPAVAA